MKRRVHTPMSTGRLEAFSDGVFAVIITIMVLDLKVPHGDDVSALRSVVPVFISYVISYLFVGIYWVNHHHMLKAGERIDGRALWANLLFLFFLSLVPFTTAWTGENHGASLPVAVYGSLFFIIAVAYTVLQTAIVAANGADSTLAKAVGPDLKGKVSLALYAVSIGVAFVAPGVSQIIFLIVALIWFVPDTRIERALAKDP